MPHKEKHDIIGNNHEVSGTPGDVVTVNGTGDGLILSAPSTTPPCTELEYTGTPQSPLLITTSSASIVVPAVPASGNNEYCATEAISLNSFSYTEGNATSGDRLITLTFTSAKSTVGMIKLFQLQALTSISFPSLTITGGEFILDDIPLLTTINLPLLTNAFDKIEFDNLTLIEIASIPSLLTAEEINIHNMDALLSVSFPALISMSGTLAVVSQNPLLNNINFPVITNIGGGLSTSSANALTTYDFTNLETIGGFLNWSSMALMTTANFPALVSAGGVGVNQNNLLTSINFPSLVTSTGSVGLQNNPLLTTVDFPVITDANGFNISNTSAVTSWTAPNLVNMGTFNGSNVSALATVSFPSVVTCGQFNPNTWNACTTFDFPLLTSCINGFFGPSGFPLLTTFSLPSLAFITSNGNKQISNMASCTTVNLPAITDSQGGWDINSGMAAVANLTFGAVGTTLRINGNLSFNNLALTVASIEQVFAMLVSLDGTGGTTLYGAGKTVNVGGGTSAGQGALSGPGAADRLTLIGRGVTVTMNP